MVSVIIPVYNPGKLFESCVSSILDQTYRDFEIILVDDGSSDGSEKKCDEYASKYSFITVKHIKNGGAANARNVGISLAKGEYISFIDSDDWIESDTFEKCIAAFERDGVDMAAYGMNIDRSYEDYVNTAVKNLSKSETLSRSEIASRFNELFYADYLSSSCTKIFRRSLLLDKNISFNKDLSFYEDLYFVLDYLAEAGKTCFLKEAFYHYRMDTTQYAITKRVSKDLLTNIDQVAQKINSFTQFGQADEVSIANVLVDLYTMYLQRVFLTENSRTKALKEIRRLQKIDLFRNSAQKSNMFDKYSKFYKILIWAIRNNITYLIYILYRKRYPIKRGAD